MVGPDKDGSLKKCYELSKKYKLNQKVEFVGYLRKIEWLEIARDHDIFINTSTIDNMPVSIIRNDGLRIAHYIYKCRWYPVSF